MIIRNGRGENHISDIKVYSDAPPDGGLAVLRQDDDVVYVAVEDIASLIQALEQIKNEFS